MTYAGVQTARNWTSKIVGGSALASTIRRIQFFFLHPKVRFVFYPKSDLKKFYKAGFRSQHGQDYYMQTHIFSPCDVNHGFFADIGCNHPTNLNNTIWFESHGWVGVAADGLPLQDLWSTRKATFIQCVIGSQRGRVRFGIPIKDVGSNPLVTSDMFAGVNRNEASPGDETFEVDQRTLADVLAGRSHVNLISIDVEGYENAVIDGIDFAEISIDVICVENNSDGLFGGSEIREKLQKQGFVFFCRVHPVDDIFVSGTINERLRTK